MSERAARNSLSLCERPALCSLPSTKFQQTRGVSGFALRTTRGQWNDGVALKSNRNCSDGSIALNSKFGQATRHAHTLMKLGVDECNDDAARPAYLAHANATRIHTDGVMGGQTREHCAAAARARLISPINRGRPTNDRHAINGRTLQHDFTRNAGLCANLCGQMRGKICTLQN